MEVLAMGLHPRERWKLRQALYEYYFSGDPVRTAMAYVAGYDKTPCVGRVRNFLATD